ncbi:putative ATP-dependent RNA helicase DHR1 [Orbilia oligospora]|uniref:RNA helicase n=1 Tax=Orbilia oligospora TaxID=2813651 RepID=A0A6G1MMN2_ORBOL|nr:putative ATP-dependent RNA helicase DHR1 [Orbilia oligospora]KAF3227033.1 putative ATP-dependent RNA helicase DHR1 [Orbilia oligospora]KAF3261682.1 putative ATP-dependent RNA helicase DHR1 [Orbilia oligospora]
MGKFVPRDRKQRNKSKSKDTTTANDVSLSSQNPNALIVVPQTAEEKEAKARRKEELRQELRSAQSSKITSKKAKRLDKYIDNKLKKEERVRLIEKLKDVQGDTSLLVKTTQLGVKHESARDQLKRAIREEKAGINVEENAAILYEEREVPTELPDSILLPQKKQTQPDPVVPEASAPTPMPVPKAPVVEIPTSLGSGLKRPLEVDEFGLPILKKIKKKKHKPETVTEEIDEDEHTVLNDVDMEEGGTWEGFGSEDDDINGKVSSESENEQESEGSDAESSEGEDESEEEEDEVESAEEDEDDAMETGEEEKRPSWRKTAGKSEKASSFKAWAEAARNKILETSDKQSTSLGAVPGEVISSFPSAASLSKSLNTASQNEEPRYSAANKPVVQPMLVKKSLDTLLSESKDGRIARAVAVNRNEDIQAQRLQLPIVGDEQRIMETIHNNLVTILCGETGSGKTTQVPQFLFEAGYGDPHGDTPGMIGVTQPRRVAAVTMAKRVADELGEHSGRVSYQIRFEGTTHANTAIKFMTDGVLLRELGEDFALRKYSAIVVDEAHERSINTDILIGALSRIVKLRLDMSKEDDSVKPLKLIIMSATLRVKDFTENERLFATPPPVVVSEARQHKVTNRFSLRTRHEYLEEAYKKVCKIHRRLPKGGILVFLTGKQDIYQLMQKLRRTFPLNDGKREKDVEAGGASVQILPKDAVTETEEVEFGGEDKFDLDKAEEDDEDQEDSEIEDDYYGVEDTTDDLIILPLFSLLPTSEQMKIWAPLKPNQRLCVIATNVAETSLTIPGISYVVDSGRVKNRNFDVTTGVQSFDVEWISKASAAQRSGRAGRTGPGQCYRLYSSALFERDFDQFAKPEISRMPIEGVVLQMKAMGLNTVVNFPFPTPPDRDEVRKAEKLLGYLGALDLKGKITKLGVTMNYFPVAPRFGRILAAGHQYKCMPYVITLVAALSVGELFVPEHQLDFSLADSEDGSDREDYIAPDFAEKMEQERKEAQRKKYNAAQRSFAMLDTSSDAIKLLTVVCAYEYETRQADFCKDKFVRAKAMQEVRKLRQQLTNIVRSQFSDAIGQFEVKLQPPKDLQVKALQQIISTGFLDQIAIRGDLLPNSLIKPNFKKVADIPYFTLFASSTARLGAKLENLNEVAVFIHPSSILVELHQNREFFPEFIVYSEMQRGATSGKVRIKPLTALTGQQLSNLAKGSPLLTFSKPLDKPAPIVKGDETGGITRECWVIPRFGAAVGKAEQGWTLPPRRVTQKKAPGSAVWTTEW